MAFIYLCCYILIMQPLFFITFIPKFKIILTKIFKRIIQRRCFTRALPRDNGNKQYGTFLPFRTYFQRI